MASRPPLYLLIEEGNRELLSRALIAVLAVRRGYRVVLGPQWVLHHDFNRLPRGIVMFKGNNLIQGRNMRRARDAGHTVASIEEEALTLSDATEILRLYSSDSIECCDLFLAQGAFQETTLVTAYPDIADHIAVTGNPRTDVLRPEFTNEIHRRADDLRDQYGRFILINTNFGSVNPAHGDTLSLYRRCIQTGLVDPSDPAGLRDFLTWAEWEKDNLHCVVAFAGEMLRAQPNCQIIIRPHPAEDPGRWHEWLDVGGPINVIREGDHLSWTAASEVMVHTSGTTGVEAMLMGQANVSLIPGDNPWHDLYSINEICPTAKTVSDAIELVIDHLDRPEESELFRRTAAVDFGDHIDVREELAAKRIVDALDRFPDHAVEGGMQLTGSISTWQGEKFDVTGDRLRQTVSEMEAALPFYDTSVAIKEHSSGVFELFADGGFGH